MFGRMEFRFHDDPPGAPVISVDGVLPDGPNFSHWPGNRTPRDLVADTSTGIALRLAELPDDDRARRLQGLSVVANNHFDTDGVLSCFAILHPEFALAHKAAFLDAATTGDFQVHTTDEALSIDLEIDRLGSDHGPHGEELRRLAGAARGQRQYEIAFSSVPALFADPIGATAAIAATRREELADLAEARGSARVETIPRLGLAIVTHSRELRRLAINTLAGGRLRVLSIVPVESGARYRFHERVESWFDMATIARAPRLDLAAIAARLNALEPARGDGARWIAQDPRSPVPEVCFGVPGSGRAIAGTVSCESRVSALPREIVIREFSRGPIVGADPE